MAGCCMFAGYNKKDIISKENTINEDEQVTTESEQSAETTTTAEFAEGTKANIENLEGIPDTAVQKVTATTYRNSKAWETFFTYNNDHKDSVLGTYINSDGKEEISSYSEY